MHPDMRSTTPDHHPALLTAALVLALWLIGPSWKISSRRAPSVRNLVGPCRPRLRPHRRHRRPAGLAADRGRRLPVADPGPLHGLAKATHAALYLLLLVIAGLGIANALVRGVNLGGPLALPRLGDPEWRRPLTHWHGLAANLLMAVALFHALAALVHHYLWHDGILRRILPERRPTTPTGRP